MSISKETVFGDYEKKMVNGKQNPKYVDLLEEDKPIAGQKFVCISFVSPEKILKQKELFFFEEFLKSWELSKGMDKFVQFLNFISYKYNMNFDDINYIGDFIKDPNVIEDNVKQLIDESVQSVVVEVARANSMPPMTDGLISYEVSDTMDDEEIEIVFIRCEDVETSDQYKSSTDVATDTDTLIQ